MSPVEDLAMVSRQSVEVDVGDVDDQLPNRKEGLIL